MLVDEFLPIFEVSDTVATYVRADVGKTWNALMNADLIDVGRRRPMVAILGALRMVPEVVSHLLHGEPLPNAPSSMRLRDLSTLSSEQGGWVLLGERPYEEIALGLVGKFWLPVIQYARVTADTFRDFGTPGYAKTVYSLSVRDIGTNSTLLSGTMRTSTTDDNARTWFRRYWTLGVGSGAHVLVDGLLDVTREAAERS